MDRRLSVRHPPAPNVRAVRVWTAGPLSADETCVAGLWHGTGASVSPGVDEAGERGEGEGDGGGKEPVALIPADVGCDDGEGEGGGDEAEFAVLDGLVSTCRGPWAFLV